MNARKLGAALLRYAILDLERGGQVARDAWEYLMLPAQEPTGWTAAQAADAAHLSLAALRRQLVAKGFGFPPAAKFTVVAPCIPKTRRTQAGWIRCERCWSISPVWDIYRAKTCIPCGRRTPRWYARKKGHAA